MASILSANAQGGPSSIGASWPPKYDARNRRIKGICNDQISSIQELMHVFRQANAIASEHPNSTRSTFRVFATKELISRVNDAQNEGYKVEAVIPSDYAIPGCDLVYFARNNKERVPAQFISNAEMEILEAVQQVAPVPFKTTIAQIQGLGYKIELLDGKNARESDVRALLKLYHTAYTTYLFDINEETVRCMIGGENRAFIGRNNFGQIVSVVIVEHELLTLGNGAKVDLFELTDGATSKCERGNGLMTAMFQTAVNLLRGETGGASAIIYAEARAPWEAINAAIQKAGHHYAGTLENACSIIGERNIDYEGTYESLNVWYDLPTKYTTP